MFTFTEVLFIIELIVKTLLIPFIALLFQYLAQRAKDDRIKSAIERIEDFAQQAVLETSQTYVDHLKETGEWNEETQKIAFEKSKDRLKLLAKPFLLEELENAVGDVSDFLDMLIEAAVKRQK